MKIGGAITAGVGAVLIAPGLYLTVTSGSKTELRSDRGVEEGALQRPTLLGLEGTFGTLWLGRGRSPTCSR